MQSQKVYLPVIVAAFFNMITVISSFAQLHPRAGVRAAGMGDAFLAISNDVNALTFNPAGLINSTHRWQAVLGGHELFLGLNNGDIRLIQAGGLRNFSYVKVVSDSDKVEPDLTLRLKLSLASKTLGVKLPPPTGLKKPPPPGLKPVDTLYTANRFSFGVHWHGIQYPGQWQHNIVFSAAYGFRPIAPEDTTVKPDRTYDINVKPEALIAGTSHQVRNRFAFGIMARYIRFDYDNSFLLDRQHVNNDAEFLVIRDFLASHKTARGDFAIDASASWYVMHRLQIAGAILNLKKPDLALSSDSDSGEFSRRIRVGVAYQPLDRLLTAVDIERNYTVGNLNVHLGAEYWYQTLAIRSGINRDWLAFGFGLMLPSKFGKNLMLNGAIQSNLHGGGFYNVLFAFNYRWR